MRRATSTMTLELPQCVSTNPVVTVRHVPPNGSKILRNVGARRHPGDRDGFLSSPASLPQDVDSFRNGESRGAELPPRPSHFQVVGSRRCKGGHCRFGYHGIKHKVQRLANSNGTLLYSCLVLSSEVPAWNVHPRLSQPKQISTSHSWQSS